MTDKTNKPANKASPKFAPPELKSVESLDAQKQEAAAENRHQFVRVDFTRFKAFNRFRLTLNHFNILVGPNNAGKSTILTAFRILEAAMRKARTKNPELVAGPLGKVFGDKIHLQSISVAEENIFYNYDDAEPAIVNFTLSNKNELTLYFPEHGTCHLIADAQGKQQHSPSSFKKNYNCPIGFVPILGPVEHHEELFGKEAARLALYNYKAARNFRNIWYHYPEKFKDFQALLKRTWPGMDIQPPTIEHFLGKTRLHMFCPEDRIPREIFWAGFGFQVWCQMLTHLIQSNDAALFLIDEPDIYLHSELQRQLLSILRNMGSDILIATHSTEIITEAEPDDIILISKKRISSRRINNPMQLEDVFKTLGTNLNPILTQLAKTRRALFVEGKDFQILGKFAQKLKVNNVSNRSAFAVVPVEGFNPERIRSLKDGMEETLGGKILAAAIMDKDYRCDEECSHISSDIKTICSYAKIHDRKEIENFLLVPSAIDRAITRKIADKAKRENCDIKYDMDINEFLNTFAEEKKEYVTAQFLDAIKNYRKKYPSYISEAQANEEALKKFGKRWKNYEWRLLAIPGKQAISAINVHLQSKYGVNITPTAIIDAMHVDEVPQEMSDLINDICVFSAAKVS